MSLTVNQFQPRLLFSPKEQPIIEGNNEDAPAIITTEENIPNARNTVSIDSYLNQLENGGSNIIYKGLIFRDSNETLIVPDYIYNAISDYNGNDAFEFAKQIAKDINDQNEINFYASWFMLIQQEGGIEYCATSSELGVDLNDAEMLTQMIQSGKFSMEEVTVTSDGKVTTNRPDNKTNAEKFSDIVQNATQEINEYRNQFRYYISQEDYDNVKSRLVELGELVNNLYTGAVNELENFDGDNYIKLSNVESKHSSFSSLLNNTNAQIDMTYHTSLAWGDTTPPVEDNNKTIDEIISIIEKEIDDMFNGISSINTESEYKEFQRKLNCFSIRLYASYNRELNNAGSKLQTEKGLLSEIESKYNQGMELLNNADIMLEELYIDGDVEVVKAGQEFIKLQNLAFNLISKVGNAYNLTYKECLEIMEQLKDVQEQLNNIFPISTKNMNNSDLEKAQSNFSELTDKMQNAYKKLESLSQILPSVTEEDRHSSFDDIINILISDLTVFNNLGYVSANNYETLGQKLVNISNRAYFALSREFDWAGENPVGEIIEKYNDFMNNYYNKAEQKLEIAYNRSRGLGRFNSLLLGNKIT